MKETLKELKRRGVKLAVLSNKPHEATYLAVTGLFGSYPGAGSGDEEKAGPIRSMENCEKTTGGAVGVHVCGRHEY